MATTYAHARMSKLLELVALLKVSRMSATALGQRLDTSQRTIYRYLDLLESLGFCIDKDFNNKFFVALDKCPVCEAVNSQQKQDDMSENLKTTQPKKKINAYLCPKLHATITEDIHEGVTPMFIPCEGCATIGVENVARSQMYLVDQNIKASHEWYKPTHDQLPALRAEWGVNFDDIMTHINKGGLLLRIKQTSNLWLPGK